MKNKKIALFYNSVEPIHRSNHAHFGINKVSNPFSFSANTNAVPIAQNELSQIAAHYPIVFVGDDLMPAAALSIEEGKNAFVNNSGQWEASYYVPMSILRYPFMLVKPEDNSEPIIAFDPEADVIAEHDADIPFFKDNAPSDLMKGSIELCHTFDKGMALAKQASTKIRELDLFTTKIFSYKAKSGETKKTQFTGINDDTFFNLSEKDFLSLRQSPALDLIFAHRFSLNSWKKLVSLHEK